MSSTLAQLSRTEVPARAHWLEPRGAIWLLILVSAALRMALAGETGLGIDESYMVALARELRLGYFDHPPVAWWLVWAATHLAGSEAPAVVRLPFVAMFAVSTWLMFRLGAELFNERAGFWAALLFNLAPQFGVASAAWVLPDGPMICALLFGALAIQRALFGRAARAATSMRWWLLCGAAAGIAMLSKYTAAFAVIGVLVFLLTSPAHRHWLAKPHPYMAAAIAAAIFAVAIYWNVEHHWASFAFQGGRAAGHRFRPLLPFLTWGGEALFVLPWLWALLVGVLAGALRRGPREPRRWLLACMAVGPIVFFALASAWSESRILYHWAGVGYLMLFPLAGAWLAELGARRAAWARTAATLTAAFVLLLTGAAAAEVRFDWVPDALEDELQRNDPDIQAVDWSSLRADLGDRGYATRPDLFIAATHWALAGKLDYGIGGAMPVVCLCVDTREYGIAHPAARQAGNDAIIVDAQRTLTEIRSLYGDRFGRIEELPPFQVLHAGKPELTLHAYYGFDYRPARE